MSSCCRMLNRYRAELGVDAIPQELELAACEGALISARSGTRSRCDRSRSDRRRAADVDVAVANLTGHKLPTAYPSRRAWLHVTVRDDAGSDRASNRARSRHTAVITGNDNDADPARYEPHYDEIRAQTKCRSTRASCVDRKDAVTTGLLRGLRSPRTIACCRTDSTRARRPPEIAVRGAARRRTLISRPAAIACAMCGFGRCSRARFGGRGRAAVSSPSATAGRRTSAAYDAAETKRFVRYYEAMAPASGIVLARDAATVTESRP